jgi:hypothetical protein
VKTSLDKLPNNFSLICAKISEENVENAQSRCDGSEIVDGGRVKAIKTFDPKQKCGCIGRGIEKEDIPNM